MNIIPSFFDNIKEKTTNPFFGTLIFVWLVRNWELIFTLLNFDKDCTLDDKKVFIRGYYFDKNIYWDGFINILIALGLLLLGYGLVIISRLVVNVTNHNIIPRMNEKTVSKLVVNKSRFETVKKARDEYYIKIEDLGEKLIVLEQKNSILKNENIKYDGDLKAFNNEFGILSKKHTVLEEVSNSQQENISKVESENKILNKKIKVLELVPKIKKNLYNEFGVPFTASEAYYSLYTVDSAVTFFYYIVNSLVGLDINSDFSKDDANKYDNEFNVRYLELFEMNNLIEYRNSSSENLYYRNNIEITSLGYLLVEHKDILADSFRDVKL